MVFVLPTVIMQAMGGAWRFEVRELIDMMLLGLSLIPFMVMGLHAVQMFVLHGEGTPIPLDGTKQLVRSGLYAYLTNPMQLSTAISWIILGIFLENMFVALAAIMAVIFVLGLVRWHHRHDLEVRFTDEWKEYRLYVFEWIPRWHPWVPIASTLSCPKDYRLYQRLLSYDFRGLDIREGECLCYKDGTSGQEFSGLSALACVLFHINFMTAWVGASILLVTLPMGWVRQHIMRIPR